MDDASPRPGLRTPGELLEGLGISRLLAFAAHPDDLDFAAAATAAALADRGVEITLCLLTAGDAGGFERGRDAEEMAQRRRREQQEAAEILGIREVIFLDERDGFVEPTLQLQKKIVRVMRQVRPDVVMSCHPERAWDRLQKSHPDHMACGEAVVRAVYPAVENPFAFPELLEEEGLEAFKVTSLLLMAAPLERIQLRVDVTGHEQQKLEALRRHLSQHPDPAGMERYVLEKMLQAGERAGAQGRSAEEFHLVSVNAEDTISGF